MRILSGMVRPHVQDLVVPIRPDPAITLSDLRAVLDRPIFLPLGTEAFRHDEKDYRFVDGYLPHAVRITLDRDFYEMHSDSVEFWTRKLNLSRFRCLPHVEHFSF